MADAGRPEPDLRAALPAVLQLGNLLSRSRLAQRAVTRAAGDLDRPALSILLTLRQAGTPLRVGEIADRMQVAGPHVTRHLHELERRGLARRVADDADRRARLVEPTDAGNATADAFLGGLLGWLGEALADWSPEDRRDFQRLLLRFVADLTSHLESPDDRPES